jgi:hypothetical protein
MCPKQVTSFPRSEKQSSFSLASLIQFCIIRIMFGGVLQSIGDSLGGILFSASISDGSGNKLG